MRTLPIVLTLLVLLALTPTVTAAWTTSAGVPATFRPDRTVSFTYTASSSSGLDLPIRWRVSLYTCQDLDADNWCEHTDAHRVDHGQQSFLVSAGATQSLTWSVSLSSPEGAYRYHYHVGCFDNPCTGQAPTASDNKTGAFQLAYTNSWKRTILAPAALRQGDAATIQYELRSTDPNDRDLSGMAQLYTTPNGEPERAHGPKTFAVNAGQTTTLSWAGISFPTVGPTEVRTTDTTGPDSTATIQVRAVHLHVATPRATYTAGNAFSLYLTLEGHGASPDPQPLDGRTIIVRIFNGTNLLASHTITTDWQGQAYVRHQTAEDDADLRWEASTSVSWLAGDYDLDENGTVRIEPASLAGIAENVTAIRENLSDVQLKGVHLDELGTRNVWMTAVRAAGAVALVIILVVLFLSVVFRV